MREIIRYLKARGYDCVDEKWYAYIKLWNDWYRGKVSSVHRYRQYNGKRHLTRERKTLGMTKSVAEDWANLALNEKVEIAIDKKAASDRINQVLEDNHFRVKGNQLLELSFALGTGAIVEYKSDGRTKIDYIRAGMIYPLSWENGDIKECAFASEVAKGKEKNVYLNLHTMVNGEYQIENIMFRKDGQVLTKIDLPYGVQAVVKTGSDVPLFQIISPNITNNLDPSCPMGISVYANALDQMEGIDLVYDSYCNEFQLGKKRITVPISMTRLTMESDGFSSPVFDDNDMVFYAMPGEDGEEKKITEHNMEIRAEAHEKGIQTGLNLISFKCGMGKDRYNFQDGVVQTATAVISSKSDLFQNLKKHELLLENALKGMVMAIAQLEGITQKLKIKINFDDSIIEDVGAEKTRFLQEITAGVRQKFEYRMQYFGEDEETAKEMTAEQDDSDSFGLNQSGGEE